MTMVTGVKYLPRPARLGIFNDVFILSYSEFSADQAETRNVAHSPRPFATADSADIPSADAKQMQFH